MEKYVLPAVGVAVAVMAILAVVLKSALSKNTGGDDESTPAVEPPFKRKDYFFSAAERSFFGVLIRCLGDRYQIFAKVRLYDLLYLPKGTIGRQRWINKVSQKHVDFVICSADIVKPLVLVELDDKSHEEEERRTRDAFVDEVAAAAGIPILHFPAKQAYEPGEIQKKIEALLAGQLASVVKS